MKTFTLRFTTIVALTLCLKTTIAQNYAMTFVSGNSNYVDFTNNAALSATNIKTMECWVKFNTLGSVDQEIMSRSIGGSGIELLYYASSLSFYAMNSSNSTGAWIAWPGTNLATGVWYHVAVAWDGLTAASMRLYVNGVSVGTLNGSITTGVNNPTGTFRIGNWSDPNPRYLNGVVDEARVWSVQRTQAQIKAGMYGTVATNTTGLIAYWNFNAGSGNTVANSTSTTGIDGTRQGATPPTWTASPIQFSPNNAIAFDGGANNITAPASANYNGTTGTVEFWAKPTTFLTAAPQMGMVGLRGHSSSNWSFHMASNQVGLFTGTYTTGTYTTAPYTFNLNQWYHFAFVSNGTNTTVYINGVAQSTLLGAFSAQTGNPLVLGQVYNPSSSQEPFAGQIDEVRIWNTARTAAQITANMNSTLTGSESGLVGLWSFDQGIANGTNSGLITVVDNTSNNNHGTMNSFNLTNSTSNFTDRPTTLPVTFTSFTGSRKDNTSILSWETAQEQNSRDFIIERSSDGTNYTSIGTVPAAGDSRTPRSYSFTDYAPASGNNFYRLKEVDLDNKFMYSTILNISFSASATGTFKLTPNPATSAINWYGDAAAGQGTLTVTDLTGRTLLIKTVQFTSGLNSVSINLTTIPAGTYILTVRDKEKTTNKQFQVIR